MIITINYVWAALGQWNCSHEPSSHLYDNWSQKLVKLSVPENPKVNSATVLFPCKLDKLKIYAAINLDIEKHLSILAFTHLVDICHRALGGSCSIWPFQGLWMVTLEYRSHKNDNHTNQIHEPIWIGHTEVKRYTWIWK